MDFLQSLVDVVLHLDVHINDLIVAYGGWTYAILFAVIFSETGLVVTPFLPGDSLLFAAGALAATGSIDPFWLFVSLSAAAILGNTLNYWLGYYIGPGILRKENVRFLNKAYLERARLFYEKRGGMTIVIARFLPILRTFAPFVAGIGVMRYTRFMAYNVAAGIAWVGLFVFAGYFFGTIPSVKNNFSLVIAAIIVISTLPAIYGYLKHRRESTQRL